MKTGNALLAIFFIGMAHLFPLGLVYIAYTSNLHDVFDPAPLAPLIFFVYMFIGTVIAIAGVEKEPEKKTELKPEAHKKTELEKPSINTKPLDVKKQTDISAKVDEALEKNGKNLPIVTKEMRQEEFRKQIFDEPVQPSAAGMTQGLEDGQPKEKIIEEDIKNKIENKPKEETKEKTKKEPETNPDEKTVNKEDDIVNSVFYKQGPIPELPDLNVNSDKNNTKIAAAIQQNVETLRQDFDEKKKIVEDLKKREEDLNKKEQ
jgi:hypothetical protein